MHLLAINYIFFTVFLLIILLGKGFKIENKAGDKLFIIISFIVLAVLHIFVDINSVEDLPGYEMGFKQMANTSLANIFDVFRKGDPLYAILNKVVVSFTNDFSFFLLLYNILLLGSHYSVLSKYSPCVPISIVMFLALNYNQSLFVLRQYIAISLLFISIPFIVERRMIAFLSLCIAAFLTHSSALLFIPLYLIYLIKNKRIFILTLMLVIAAFSSLNTDIGGYLLLLNIDYGEYVDFNADYNLTVKLIPVVHLCVYIVALKKHIIDEGINKLCLIALILYAAGYVFAPSVGLLSRILKYYELFLLFSIPITFQYLRGFVIRFIYLFSVVGLHGYLAIRNLSEFYFADYKLGYVNIGYIVILLITLLLLYKYVINKMLTNNLDNSIAT